MPPVSDTDRLYGPPLGELLGSEGLVLPQAPIPSRNEIRQAIYSLSDPQSVSYVSFATILAMAQTPACDHLELLASDASIFPSCIKLLRKYCHVERRGLFDHAYGLLCFQTMVLSVQVAILLQTKQFGSFLTEIPQMPQGSSIFPLLHDRVLQAEMEASFGAERQKTTWLLGWYDYKIAGRSWTSCLRQIGGFTIDDAKFLVEQIWSARADFLPVAMAAGRRFYGWGSLMHVMWRILGNNYGIGWSRMGFEGPGAQTHDQRQCWIHFADIGNRYALCSSEVEDSLMPALLVHCPKFSKPWTVTMPGSSLGALDSIHIAQAFLTKLQYRPRLHITFSSMLFSYTCTNLKHPDISNSISQVWNGILERSWLEVTRIQELNPEQIDDLLAHVTNVLSNLMDLLTVTANPEQAQCLADVISDEIFIEFLGRLILSPLLTTGETLNVRQAHTVRDQQSTLAKQLFIFGSRMRSATLHTGLGLCYFLAWHKIAQHLNYCLYMPDMSQFVEQGHVHPWQGCWSRFGSSLDLEERFHLVLHCDYPRCATPNSMQLWECSGCDSKRYCSQRCQKADWAGQPSPHIHQCGSLQ